MSEDSREVWEQRDSESSVVFMPFQHYRDAGPSRSLSQTALAVGKSRKHLEALSSKNDWAERCRAFDLHKDRVSRFAEERALDRGAGKWAAEIERVRAEELQDATLLRQKAREALERLILTEVSLREVAQALGLAAELERRAAGLADPGKGESAPVQNLSAAKITINLPGNGREIEVHDG